MTDTRQALPPRAPGVGTRYAQVLVKAGLFRQDLLFRLNQFEVEVPPLRERLEEIPWLMQLALKGRAESLHVSIVEAALVRWWPGNVRELRSATLAARKLGLHRTQLSRLRTRFGLKAPPDDE